MRALDPPAAAGVRPPLRASIAKRGRLGRPAKKEEGVQAGWGREFEGITRNRGKKIVSWRAAGNGPTCIANCPTQGLAGSCGDSTSNKCGRRVSHNRRALQHTAEASMQHPMSDCRGEDLLIGEKKGEQGWNPRAPDFFFLIFFSVGRGELHTSCWRLVETSSPANAVGTLSTPLPDRSSEHRPNGRPAFSIVHLSRAFGVVAVVAVDVFSRLQTARRLKPRRDTFSRAGAWPFQGRSGWKRTGRQGPWIPRIVSMYMYYVRSSTA